MASAKAKILNIANRIAFPDWILDDAALNAFYAHLNFQPDDDPFLSVNKVSIL
jgi:hypothetical protein